MFAAYGKMELSKKVAPWYANSLSLQFDIKNVLKRASYF
jgi:hypothetical protein